MNTFETRELLKNAAIDLDVAIEKIKNKESRCRTNTERQQLNRYNRENRCYCAMIELLTIIYDNELEIDSNTAATIEQLVNKKPSGNGGQRAFNLGDNIMDVLLKHPSYNMTKLRKAVSEQGWYIEDYIIQNKEFHEQYIADKIAAEKAKAEAKDNW